MCYKLNPEATPECKICTARQYRLGCKGRDVCGIFSDIRGTHEGIKRLWEKRVREEMHSTKSNSNPLHVLIIVVRDLSSCIGALLFITAYHMTTM